MTDSQENHNNPNLCDDTISPLPRTTQLLYRSQSIQEQLNRTTPKITPAHWGHLSSKSLGGNDWPLPASGTTIPNTYTIPSEDGQMMDFTMTGNVGNDQFNPPQNLPKKRGPKPKNEPAATV